MSTNRGLALNRVLDLAEFTSLEGQELTVKQGAALDLLDLYVGVQNIPLGTNPLTGEPLPRVEDPNAPGEFLPVGTDPVTLQPTPERITHYRPWIVAAQMLLTDQSAQILSKAEEGVTFTNLEKPILALINTQAAYDERWKLHINYEAQAATIRQFAADIFRVDLSPVGSFTGLSGGMIRRLL